MNPKENSRNARSQLALDQRINLETFPVATVFLTKEMMDQNKNASSISIVDSDLQLSYFPKVRD